MKYKVEHSCRGRIRVRLTATNLSPNQADALEAALQTLPCVTEAIFHERTGCAVLLYTGSRAELLASIKELQWRRPIPVQQTESESPRVLNRHYQSEFYNMVAWKVIRDFVFPAPLQTAFTCVRALPYLWRGFCCLRQREWRVELLDGLSIGCSLLRHSYSTASSVMFLLKFGDLLEEWTHKRSIEGLARSMTLHIDKVWIRTDAGEALVPLAQIKQDDIICVKAGNVIPMDGIVVDGEAMVNQASLTGESVAVAKRSGFSVYAGTVVEEGSCAVRVSQSKGGSRYDRIVDMIEQSERMKSTAEKKAANLADKLVPYTLLTSIITYVFTRNLVRASSVLMVDFSCALKLSMPLAVLSAMREGGSHHITVKGGRFLELVHRADTIVFDKTGTLTRACPSVACVVPFGGHDEREMLRLSACLEEHFPHSIANAVVRAAEESNLVHQEMHAEVEYLVAHGIATTVCGKRTIIGSAHFVFEDERAEIPVEEQNKFNELPTEYSHLYLAIGGKLAAVICITDPLRSEAPQVIRQLRNVGFSNLVMLTGDSERTAATIAKQVGVDSYRAEVLPEDKAAFVEEQRAAGHTVLMLGDGINDSPALSAADVGIAIREGAAIASQVADITIGGENLRDLVVLRQLADALMDRIGRNYRFTIGFNGSLIALGAAGIIAPTTSALLHNTSTLALSLYSMTDLLK